MNRQFEYKESKKVKIMTYDINHKTYCCNSSSYYYAKCHINDIKMT